MYPYLENNAQVVVIVSAFLLCMAVWAFVVSIWFIRRSSRSQKVEERLGLTEPEGGATRVLRLWYEGREVTTAVPGQARHSSLIARLRQYRNDAGWEMPLRSIVLGVTGLTALVFLVGFVLMGRLLAGMGAAVMLLLILWIYLRHAINRRMATFDAQFVDALELAARSLRAGHPLVGAFRLISEEIRPPVGTLFAGICRQQDLGVGLEDAVQVAASSCSSSDVKLFATSIVIQLRSGGNLADMMERLASVIRDRTRLSRRFQVLTAQTQLSKRILIALPVVLFVVMNAINPKYMEPLYTTPLGQSLLIFAGASLMLGVWAMNRMVVLRY
jgi:tight adherence protein B